MLEQGKSTFSQKQLFFSSYGYGLTDNISVQLGTVLPLIFFDDPNVYIAALKFGFSWDEYLHSTVGVQAFFVDNEVLNIPYWRRWCSTLVGF